MGGRGSRRAGFRATTSRWRSAAMETRLSLPCAIERLSSGISHRTCNACPIRIFARLDRILGDKRSGLVAPYRPRVEIASPERLPRRVSRSFIHARTFPDRLALWVGSAEHGIGSRAGNPYSASRAPPSSGGGPISLLDGRRSRGAVAWDLRPLVRRRQRGAGPHIGALWRVRGARMGGHRLGKVERD
jgi:hypothetical protein